MDLDLARSLLRQQHRSVLATVRSDGRPQMSPVVHAVDDNGRLLVSSREPAYKVRNLRRDPRASLCAVPDGFFGEWVQADGRATIVPLPDALPMLEEYYRRVSGEHPDWDDYRAAMVRDRRVMIVIDIERAGPDRAG
jgi:PPOX class probable F420-dependent enzyme